MPNKRPIPSNRTHERAGRSSAHRWRGLMVISVGLALGACTGDGDSEETESGPSDTSASGTVGTGVGGSGLAMTADDGTATAAVFIEDPDGGGVAFECDLFAQDCPEGEKCMPWANDGGDSWNATRCSMVDANPGEPGDECTVEGTGTAGVDTCGVGIMCWDVDPTNNTGVCVAMCTGDEASPVCDNPDTSCAIANDGAIVLCLANCDPLVQDCAEGQACYLINDAFTCAPDASGEMGAYADPCEFINVCDPGLLCVVPSLVPDCNDALGCCTEVCDLSLMDDAQCSGQAQGQLCTALFNPGEGPPGYDAVGYCALPS